MIQKKMTFRILGLLLWLLTGMMLLCLIFPIYYGEDDLKGFAITAGPGNILIVIVQTNLANGLDFGVLFT